MYLIPANSKKSMLILGFFTPVDLVIFIVGVTLTIILALFIKATAIPNMILVLFPGLTAGLLIMPVPYYHNVRQLIANFLNYYTGRRTYVWKGWCWQDGKSSLK